MESINYVINPYVTIRKVGLKKYLVKQGIISSKSFVLEGDDLSEKDIHFLDKVATEHAINLSQLDCSSDLKNFLIEESILIEEYLSNTEKYYSLLNSGKENFSIENKKIGILASSSSIANQLKDNFKDTSVSTTILTIENFEKGLKGLDFIISVWGHYDSMTFHRINSVLLEKNIPFMINFIDGNTTFISPIFINQETVCYNEMEIQLESALFYKDSYLAYKNAKKIDQLNFPNFLLGQALFFSTHLTLDFLISGRLKTKNRAFIFDLESLRYDIVDILPEPYCLGCRSENKKVHDFL
ncbi:TPA: hypothetical protein U3L45_000636 [Streptococcus agalactiae]|uniref:Uncharacterized protein n=1 Tax=Candidatus Coprosoma intestinipullorum TaxID=2840752 RepID=A0A9D0ZQ06_9FIRM|nr:hypothetical protein [Streptococcus agalactiae]HIQ90058.1 hypothetical protein [Candidatus Coprosoma intestinipullorum]HEM9597894.1 hypothetical protein [Streptococcus agalactiae]HEM9634787.1 hypothetical protein [Streptococcus agalactiae]HEM9645172.1 hypothetical protein [Streptococcus agalactiae]